MDIGFGSWYYNGKIFVKGNDMKNYKYFRNMKNRGNLNILSGELYNFKRGITWGRGKTMIHGVFHGQVEGYPHEQI